MVTPLPQPLRAFKGVSAFIARFGKEVDPEQHLKLSQAERWAIVPSRFVCKPGPRSIRTQDVLVPGRDGNEIPARIYTHPHTKPDRPAFLFIHGGGFVIGGVDFCDNVQRRLADRGYVVIGLSYRLAPQHPFPAALHDCADVLQWMHDTKPADLDPTRIAVGGESAGGNLTVALSLYSRDNGGPKISHQSVYYPFTDTSLASPDWDNGLMGTMINRASGELMVRAYGGEDPFNPLVNVLAADLARLPPTTVITCGHDVLTTDGTRLVEELTKAGVPTLHTHHDDLPHGFLMSSRLTRRSHQSIDEMANEAGQRLRVADAVKI